MKKHKTRKGKRKIQKGGDWLNPSTWFSSNPNPIANQNWSDYFSNLANKTKQTTSGVLDSANSFIGQTANSISNTTSQAINSGNQMLNQNVSVSSSLPQNQIYGGRRRRKTRRRCMKGGLGLVYYAAPVSGLKVAQPTSWQYYANGTNQYTLKAGSKRRKKN
jgi:hypothetical protein